MSESKEYFNNFAENWDGDTMRTNIAQSVSRCIHKMAPPKKDSVMLDFGCGTGLVSFFFYPHLSRLEGLDTSEGMVSEFNRKAEDSKFSNARAFLFHENDSLKENYYDIVVSSMVFHHLEHPEKTLKDLFSSLKSGGKIAIADLDKEDGTFHPEGTPGIYHEGFERDTMRSWLQDAGFQEVELSTAVSVPKNNRQYPIFLVSAKKP